MQAIINFLTGTLNTVAWLYIFLPCTILGGLYLTIRNRGIQFTKFGYTMKNTLGKMFQKQEAGAGAVTPMQHRWHVTGNCSRWLWRCVLAVAGGVARHDDQIFRSCAVYPLP